MRRGHRAIHLIFKTLASYKGFKTCQASPFQPNFNPRAFQVHLLQGPAKGACQLQVMLTS